MTQTYCGKDCGECACRERTNCPGCQAGSERGAWILCELAQCCRSKGHESCDTCIFKGNCGMLRDREQAPQNRQQKLALEEARRAAVARRAPLLGRWLWILFWLVIPSSVAGLLTNDTIVAQFPVLMVPGTLLRLCCAMVYGGILLRLSGEEASYRTAGVFYMISAAVTGIAGLMGESGWALLLLLLAIAAEFAAVYSEFQGHGAVLQDVDAEFSEKWRKLWGWYIGAYVAMVLSLLIIVIIPVLGLLVTLAGAVVLIVVCILKLVYLYRTAKLFRECSDVTAPR